MTRHQKTTVQIIAVSPDTHGASKRLAANLEKQFAGEYGFPLLEDKNHAIIDRYGILNPEGKGLPHPATYIIDKAGVVHWKYVEVDYAKRPTNDQILDEILELAQSD